MRKMEKKEEKTWKKKRSGKGNEKDVEKEKKW